MEGPVEEPVKGALQCFLLTVCLVHLSQGLHRWLMVADQGSNPMFDWEGKEASLEVVEGDLEVMVPRLRLKGSDQAIRRVLHTLEEPVEGAVQCLLVTTCQAQES